MAMSCDMCNSFHFFAFQIFTIEQDVVLFPASFLKTFYGLCLLFFFKILPEDQLPCHSYFVLRDSNILFRPNCVFCLSWFILTLCFLHSPEEWLLDGIVRKNHYHILISGCDVQAKQKVSQIDEWSWFHNYQYFTFGFMYDINFIPQLTNWQSYQ